MLEKLTKEVIAGATITPAQAEWLALRIPKSSLYEASAKITRTCCPPDFDFCSIINAKSGQCPENCKWCAQSAHHSTRIECYGLVDSETCLRHAQLNEERKIKRFALVTSGRKPNTSTLKRICDIYRLLARETNLSLCASLGLVDRKDLEQLQESGVKRYHCNLETAASFFPTLCTTHTQQEKITTIKAAQTIGMEVCSGGIIGMGETLSQRIELAFQLRELNILSIPINLLQPIAGTPLEHIPPLEEEEILTTIALFRFINPKARLRFAGGRKALSRELQQKALAIGINAEIAGDMLTTPGCRFEEDKQIITQTGYTL